MDLIKLFHILIIRIIVVNYFLPRGKFSFQLIPADPVLPTEEREERGVQLIADLAGNRTCDNQGLWFPRQAH